ncbi:hypothetical protein SPRG_03513 [Saprolegnia parasitica CBS 223.65]|uniref:Calcineurin-like phosphoesterase domain-containing protein n=1 Tax=Saprolegnia parasitica (strain CBS 223.65) TaxID=695850 RepID=A0A067CLK7_SAPPC|nr:hypothetical protein SPRG_03513 [Saprolegnia parasitica CBS 223.65]KDO31584.1 hypothetical protein SPRG_03513 [Saprolegnia parasitica CBS 223.65]|eukprot:XP_012197487.1 hypothetical protein SPRG_03513 [Saprolegnia parasitica CBS 223.65]
MTGMKLCYCTDVEGNIEYFNRYVALSEGVYYDGDGHLELRPGYIFVFGGDAGDKGLGTLRLYRLLIDIKTKYPTRVVLIAGNRDVNKMRFTSELTPTELDLATMSRDIVDGPLWVPTNVRVSVRDFLCSEVLQQSPDTYVSASTLASVNTKVNRVKWMLKHTMGSDGDFERRRVELQSSQGGTVSDEDVVASYVSSVEAGGILREYLQLCVLGYVHGPNLFVHGGVMNKDGDGCVGYVPSSAKPRDDLSITSWIRALNAWYDSQLAEWIAQPTWLPDHSFRGGQSLQAYGLPVATHSVINGRHLYPSGMPRLLPKDVVARLWQDGICRLIMGHTPHGISPTIVKQPSPDGGVFETIMCDTSYSDASRPDNRGNCVSELIVEGDCAVLRGHIDTASIHEVFDFSTSDSGCVGYQLPNNGPWVKLRTTDGAYLLCTITNGFSYVYEEMEAAVVESLMTSSVK